MVVVIYKEKWVTIILSNFVDFNLFQILFKISRSRKNGCEIFSEIIIVVWHKSTRSYVGNRYRIYYGESYKLQR